MRRQLMLKDLVYRLKLDTELLEKHPEKKELLKRRIKRYKDDIANYVASKSFSHALGAFNLQQSTQRQPENISGCLFQCKEIKPYNKVLNLICRWEFKDCMHKTERI